MEYVLGGEAPFQVLEPPAGPPKMSNSLGESTFHENLDFLVSYQNLYLSTDFSITHRQTQRMQFWIAFELTKGGKLLWSETNSRILRYSTFSVQNLHFFDNPIEARLGARGKPSTYVYRAE